MIDRRHGTSFPTGTVNTSLVGMREVFILTLLCGAVYMILVRNHPSGLVTPSKENDQVCRKVLESGKILSIPLTDFMIIGDGIYYSYREESHIIGAEVI